MFVHCLLCKHNPSRACVELTHIHVRAGLIVYQGKNDSCPLGLLNLDTPRCVCALSVEVHLDLRKGEHQSQSTLKHVWQQLGHGVWCVQSMQLSEAWTSATLGHSGVLPFHSFHQELRH